MAYEDQDNGGIQRVRVVGSSGSIRQSVTTIGTEAAALPTTALAARTTILAQNVGATTIYLGSATVVASTAASGGPYILPGQSVPIDLGAGAALYAISSAAGGLVACLEVAR